ncbi:hypothetical protein [Clostridium sardiniense]|uniref:hypothetical protein n=1 Tax=Clostridium sardiniense TaxID=29369 RepID=UPI001956B3EE|nr:hypothetical protein [Clostridium sardiniense]MBM7835741.1 hypothetical protein [Clostridium sardiniense]
MSRIQKMSIDDKLKNLGVRVFKNKMIIEKVDGEDVNVDEKDFMDICEKTWGHGMPSRENLERFNKLIVETAETIAEPKITGILNLLAQYKNADIDAVVMYDIPKTTKPKILYAANGSGVDLVRLSGNETKKLAQRKTFGYGGYYEITSFMGNPEQAFKDAVAQLANAKIEKFFELMFECMKESIKNAQIPSNNVKEGSNLTLSDFQKVENVMIRLGGGRPLFIADTSLINHFANQIPTAQVNLLTDDVRDMLREDLVPSKISKSLAMSFPNPWIDEKNSEVKFNVKQGFMFPSNAKGKPFGITEYGNRREYSEIDKESERVEILVKFDADVTLLNGRFLGVVEEDTITV